MTFQGLLADLRKELVYRPRDAHAAHRTATPLELFFDLVFVIAIASAAASLHHAISEGHAAEGFWVYALAFFAIWWAWMNYTWFSSAYDDDSISFRILSMVIMAGALIMAAGLPILAATGSVSVMILGYVVMRLAMIVLWRGAARGESGGPSAANAYVAGIATAQVYWVLFALIGASGAAFGWLILLGIAIELAVPMIAERRKETPWHRHHIIERYGLLIIIVLGETLLAASLALGAGGIEGFNLHLVWIALCSTVMVFAMWWLYFTKDEHLRSSDLAGALVWGYGHFFIFAAAAAVGAGMAVQVDLSTDHAHTTQLAGDLALAIPLAVYFLGIWLVRDRHSMTGLGMLLLPGAAVLCVFFAYLPFSLTLMTALSVALIWLRRQFLKTC